MKLKTMLLTTAAATALTLGSPVYAADNWALVNQQGNSNVGNVLQASPGTGNQTRLLQGNAAANGNNNNALIKQLGSYNLAGFSQYGDLGWTLRQFGHNNTLEIYQEGNNNEVGMDNGNRYRSVDPSKTADYLSSGVQQSGSQNVVTISQINPADTYSQNVVGAVMQVAATNATALTNRLQIKQGGLVTGTDGPRHFVGYVSQNHTGGARNKILIDQTGGGYSTGHLLRNVTQNGADNVIDIDQAGLGNFLDYVTQLGSGNEALLDVNGNYNGTAAMVGAAGAAGAQNSSSVQIGSDNKVGLTIANANGNDFGFYQNGTGNQAVQVLITGNDNQLGVSQVGNGNKLLLAAISGDQNNVGLRQTGDNNTASVTIAGSGDRNGGALGFGSPAVPGTLTAGLLVQTGVLNTATLNVTGSDNVFGTLQDNSATNGAGNSIIGNVTGDLNMAAVSQVGNGNDAIFTQTGGSNDVIIQQ